MTHRRRRPAVGWEAQRRRAFLLGLAPALARAGRRSRWLPAAGAAGHQPDAAEPGRPGRAPSDFDDPLVQLPRSAGRPALPRTRSSTQLKLSAVERACCSCGVGLGVALLLERPRACCAAARTRLPDPDGAAADRRGADLEDPLHARRQPGAPRAGSASACRVRSLIANPDTALWAIAVADTWQWFPFTMLMVLAALQMIPDEPLEAARLDGADRWQLFRYIVFPYIRPVLVVCGLFRLIDSFKAFPLIYVLTNGGPGTRHRGHQLLRLRPGLQLLLLGLCQRHRRR